MNRVSVGRMKADTWANGRPLEVWWLECWMLKSEPALGMLVRKTDDVKECMMLKRSAPQLMS